MKVSELLEMHKRLNSTEYDTYRHAKVVLCKCGSRHPEYSYGRWPTHEEHVAEIVDKAQAEAWDEGFRKADQQWQEYEIPPNKHWETKSEGNPYG